MAVALWKLSKIYQPSSDDAFSYDLARLHLHCAAKKRSGYFKSRTDLDWYEQNILADNPAPKDKDQTQRLLNYIHFNTKSDKSFDVMDPEYDLLERKFARTDVVTAPSSETRDDDIKRWISTALLNKQMLILRAKDSRKYPSSLSIVPCQNGFEVIIFKKNIVLKKQFTTMGDIARSDVLLNFLKDDGALTIESFQRLPSNNIFKTILRLIMSVFRFIFGLKQEQFQFANKPNFVTDPFQPVAINTDSDIESDEADKAPQSASKVIKENSYYRRLPNEERTLYMAVRSGDLKTVGQLYRADKSYSENLIEELLILAIKHKQEGLIKTFLAYPTLNVQYKDSKHKSLAMYAAEHEQVAVLKFLKIHGADLKAEDDVGRTVYDHGKQYRSMRQLLNGNAVKRTHEYDQNTIIDRLNNFLTYKGREDKLNQAGVCSGLGFLYGYSKWLSSQPNPKNLARDDYQWFHRMQQLASKWQTPKLIGKKLSKNDEKELERFISLIKYYQDPSVIVSNQDAIRIGLQSEYETYFAATGEQSMHYDLGILVPVTTKRLESYLAHLPENKFIRISGEDHTVTIIKQNGTYFYYDANSVYDERVFDAATLDKLASLVTANIYEDEAAHFDIEIKVFSFGDQTAFDYEPIKVLAKEDLLGMNLDERRMKVIFDHAYYQKLKDTVTILKESYEKGHSPFERAMQQSLFEYAGDKRKFKQFMHEMNLSIDRSMQDDALPLHQAVRKEDPAYFDNMLLHTRLMSPNQVKQTVDAQDDKGRTALMIAAFMGQHERVMALIALGADPNIKMHGGHDTFVCAEANLANKAEAHRLASENAGIAQEAYTENRIDQRALNAALTEVKLSSEAYKEAVQMFTYLESIRDKLAGSDVKPRVQS